MTQNKLYLVHTGQGVYHTRDENNVDEHADQVEVFVELQIHDAVTYELAMYKADNENLRNVTTNLSSDLNFRESQLETLRNELQLAKDAFESVYGKSATFKKLTGYGQINEGDSLVIEYMGKRMCVTANVILQKGTDEEEVIYNRKRNFYFITSMVLAGTSNHKNVYVVPLTI